MIDLATLSLGEWVVIATLGVLVLAYWWVIERYDLIDPQGPPDFKQAWSALKHGTPMHSYWRVTDEGNRVGYGLLVLLTLAGMAFILGHDWIIWFVNQL